MPYSRIQNRKIKIVHIITRLEYGGPPIALLEQIACLNKNKYECTIATGFCPVANMEMMPYALKQEIKVLPISNFVRDIRPVDDLKALFQLIRMLRENSFDIAHCHTSKAGFIGRIAAKLAGIKIILYSPHGTILEGYFSPVKTRLFVMLEKFAALLTNRILEDRKEALRKKPGEKKTGM